MSVPFSELAGRAVRVGIGDSRVGGPEDAFRVTLGSCVGLALVWPEERRFGIAHVLLPESGVGVSKGPPSRYADTVVPYLLECLDVPRSRRRQVEAYMAGGASMFSSGAQQNNVGEKNRTLLRQSLLRHRIRLRGEDVGGEQPRQLVVVGPSHVLFVMALESGEIQPWPLPEIWKKAA